MGGAGWANGKVGEAQGEALGAGLRCSPRAGGRGRGTGRVHRVGGGAASVSAPRTADSGQVTRPESLLPPESFRGIFSGLGRKKRTHFQSLEVDVSYWG